jgi:hypothetical protein
MLIPREAFGVKEWMQVQGMTTDVSSNSLPLLGILVCGLLQPFQHPPNTV